MTEFSVAFSKMATAAYILLAVVFMYFNWLRQASPLLDVVVWVALGLTLVSAGDYFLRVRKLVNEPG